MMFMQAIWGQYDGERGDKMEVCMELMDIGRER